MTFFKKLFRLLKTLFTVKHVPSITGLLCLVYFLIPGMREAKSEKKRRLF